jgi:hypothetical protein
VRPHAVAILDTMWGSEPGEAPPYFKINPNNHSGRRLYSLLGDGFSLLVTDSCRELVTSASQHGKPDPAWLLANLTRMESNRHIDVLLVCGKVAQKTYAGSDFDPGSSRVIEMPHPAARFIWTDELIARLRGEICGGEQRMGEGV